MLLFKLCYNADTFMYPDTTVIFNMRSSRWLLVLFNDFSILKWGGGSFSVILPTKFDHSRRILPDMRPLFDNIRHSD